MWSLFPKAIFFWRLFYNNGSEINNIIVINILIFLVTQKNSFHKFHSHRPFVFFFLFFVVDFSNFFFFFFFGNVVFLLVWLFVVVVVVLFVCFVFVCCCCCFCCCCYLFLAFFLFVCFLLFYLLLPGMGRVAPKDNLRIVWGYSLLNTV